MPNETIHHDNYFIGNDNVSTLSIEINNMTCPICGKSTSTLVKNTVKNKIVGCGRCIKFIYSEEQND